MIHYKKKSQTVKTRKKRCIYWQLWRVINDIKHCKRPIIILKLLFRCYFQNSSMLRWEGADTKKDYSFKSTGKKKKQICNIYTHARIHRQTEWNKSVWRWRWSSLSLANSKLQIDMEDFGNWLSSRTVGRTDGRLIVSVQGMQWSTSDRSRTCRSGLF